MLCVAVELTTPWSMSSSLSSPRGCGPLAELVSTSAGARYSTSPSQHSSTTLDSSLWRKQVCEVRPNRSSTLGRFPPSDGGGRVSVDAYDKTTPTVPRLDTVISPSVTATKATGAPRPPARSSSDCCRCRFMRAVSTSMTSSLTLPPPPPPPPPHSATSSAELAYTATRVTSETVKDFCVHVEEAVIVGAGSGSASCLLRAGSGHHRTADLGLCSVAADGSGSARYCLEDIRELDETSTVDMSNTQKPVTAAEVRPLATSCTLTTFV